MPFASLAIPSIALAQVKAAVEARLPGETDIETLYLNHEFAGFLGDLGAYQHVLSNHGFMTGLGDWFFRKAAFPAAPDNTSDYHDRYYARTTPEAAKAWQLLVEKRDRVDEFLDGVIASHHLAEADIVGFTALFAQTVASFALARRLKAVNPSLVIVMGGAACTGEMGLEFSRQIEAVDHFFQGPALVSFPEFVKRHRDGDRSGARVIAGGELDIDTNLMLDYDAFLDSVERHFRGGEVQPILLFETSRGCWWGERQRCTFCGLNGTSLCFKAMTPGNAVKQIQSLFRYAPRCSFIESVDTVLPLDYMGKVMPLLAPPPGLKIQYEVRATLGVAELEVLCKAGVTVLQPGIESLSSATLKLMRKGTTAFQNLRFLKACAQFPLTVGWNLLIFSPGETEETYERYLRLIPRLTHLHPPQAASLIGYVRYSEYFEHPGTYGLELRPEDHYRLTFPFGAEAVGRVAIKFYDAHAEVPRMESWLRRLNAAVDQWRVRWLNGDRRQEARLCLAEEGTVLYDSRDGSPTLYRLDETTRALLAYLESPRKEEDIQSAFSGEEGAKALKVLRERGVVFEEEGRVLSLVTGG